MKLIKPSYEIWEQEPGLMGIYRAIERAGRVCYKSEDKITEDSAEGFVNRMIKSGHHSMLEHGTVYLLIDCSGRLLDIANKYTKNKYSRWSLHKDGRHYCITTNLRVLVENGWLDDLKYLCEPTEFHEKRVTVHFVANIHFYKDTTRHRVFSWAIESTRFCNYLKEKFGMSVSFMKPTWIKDEDISELEEDCKIMESIYFKWIKKGYQAQHAAYFLPQGTKAEVVMTGFTSDYDHFFDLRAIGTTGEPHPDVKALAKPLMIEFKNREYIK